MKVIILILITSISFLSGHTQNTASVEEIDKYLLTYKQESNTFVFENYVLEIYLYEYDEYGFETDVVGSAFDPILFKFDRDKEIIIDDNVISIPLIYLREGEDATSDFGFGGFYANLIKSKGDYKFVNISAPYYNYWKKVEDKEEAIFSLESTGSQILNYSNPTDNKLLSKTYTQQEIKTHFLHLLKLSSYLSDSNYLYLNDIEMGENTELPFFTAKNPEVTFNGNIIKIKTKAYENITELNSWGDLYQLTDDLTLNAQLREQQEKASGQYFTLTLKYYNSVPIPSFELIKITPPNGLIWESLPNNKFLLRMSTNNK